MNISVINYIFRGMNRNLFFENALTELIGKLYNKKGKLNYKKWRVTK
jgi:hypothetical protein